jgi:hypothetical protein
MPMRLALDCISAIKGLLTGDTGYFKAIMKAEWAFIKWWMFNRSASKMPLKRNKPLNGYFPGNIAWQHFVRKKQYFSEIVGKTS